MTNDGILEEQFFLRPTDGQVLTVPLLIVGGSTAAYTAALSALESQTPVCLVQPHHVLGGQFTTQGLPASDDGKLLTPYALIPPGQRDPQQLRDSEQFALSRTQRQFRQCQRQSQPVADQVITNPGGSWVSHLSVTPTVAANCLNQGIQDYLDQGLLTLIPWADPVQVLMQKRPGQHRRLTGVCFVDSQTQHQFTVMAQITIEATDLGLLLELGHVPARVGQEARSDTHEAALPPDPRPDCQQAITFCAIVERGAHPCSPVPSPPGYDFEPWLRSRDFTSVFWFQAEEQWQHQAFYDTDGMFRYRRLLRHHHTDEVQVGDVTVLNWATSPLGIEEGPPDPSAPLGCGNDFPFGGLLGISASERQQQAIRGRDRTQAYLHYLQTHEFPELKPRGDLTWTDDGIALAPYIREACRGIALTTIRHEDVAAKFFPGQARAHTFTDSVGIGQYHYLDVHPNDADGHVELGDGHDVLPFTLPLGALIPIDTDGLILSSKSIGTTHITNAAYRMHPMEWAIGEAGGHLVAFALAQHIDVREVAQHAACQYQFQSHLAQQGIPLVWFNDLSHDDPDFAAIQTLAATGILPIADSQVLHFNPEKAISRARFYMALASALGWPEVNPIPTSATFADVPPTHFAFPTIETFMANGIAISPNPQRFDPQHSLTHQHLISLGQQLHPRRVTDVLTRLPEDTEKISNRESARLLYQIWTFTSLLKIDGRSGGKS